MTKVVVNEDSEAVWLYKAGRSVVFIAKHLGIHKRTVLRELRKDGVMGAPKKRPGSVFNSSTMNASTIVPEGDPLLSALIKHHPERHLQCLKKENLSQPQPGQTKK